MPQAGLSAEPGDLLRDVTDAGLIKSMQGICLSAQERSTNGGKVHMWDCNHDSKNQQWTYDGSSGRIKNLYGICLDASQRSTNGGEVHMWTCQDGNLNQQWSYDASSGRIRNWHGICLDAPGRQKLGGEVHMWQCLSGELNQEWMFLGPETSPPATCSTAKPGEACYQAVEWAKSTGILANPQWYPGLTEASAFEDFQAFLHSRGTNGGVCADAPCPATQPAPQTTTAAPAPATTVHAGDDALGSACTAVLHRTANDDWSSGTCGSRITWLRSSTGGALSKVDAVAQAALSYSNCEPCWPWPKYKAVGDRRVSAKRGIALQNVKLTEPALDSLATVVSWGKIWDFQPGNEGQSDLATWANAGVRFVPMVWGAKQLKPAESAGLPAGSIALLGFNEPNFPEQADLTPQQAADLWPRLEKMAADAGIRTLVSPAMNFNIPQRDPFDWLTDFLAACRQCKVDAIAFHSYTCYGRWLKDHIDRYRTFGKPLWLTEFACSDPASPERLSMEGQMAYMKEAIPLLEHDPDVQKYAWFSYFKDEWTFPIVSGKNGDAGLVYPDGHLSSLGEFYASFESTEPVEALVQHRRRRRRRTLRAEPSPFMPIDGGNNRVCRGAHGSDNASGHYQVYAGTSTLDACKAHCTSAPSCKGIEYNQAWRRCEVWTRSDGIGATRPQDGFMCLRYEASVCHTAVAGEACHTAVIWAKETGVIAHPGWYPGLSSSSSFKEFQAHLYRTGANDGICAKPPC